MLFRNYCVAILIFSYGLIPAAKAQNHYFEDWDTGVGTYAGLGGTDTDTFLSTGFSCVWRGRYGLGLDLVRTTSPLESASSEHMVAYNPRATVSLIKPTRWSAFGFEITGDYYHADDNGSDREYTTESWSMGSTVYMEFRPGGAFLVYPGLGASYRDTRIELAGPAGPSTEDITDLESRASLGVMWKQVAYVSTEYRHFDGNDRWSVSLGLVISTSSH